MSDFSEEAPNSDTRKDQNPSAESKASKLNNDESNLQKASFSVSAEFAGPIPPPNILDRYNQVLPDAADRIMHMAELEQKHRQSMQKKLIDAQISDAVRDRDEARLGQVFGLTIGITSIIAGSTTAILGAPIAGGFIGTAGVTGLVAVFVFGRKSQRPSNSLPEIQVIDNEE